MRQRQLFRLFVAGLLMVLLTPTRALALNNGDTFTSYTTEGISMTFQIISTTDMTCRVYGYYNSSTSSYTPAIDNFTSGKVTIPSAPSGYKVVEIGEYAFYQCEKITTVSMPNTVTWIDRIAFYNCTSLTSITGIANLEYIYYNAFDGTPWLSNLPDGMVYIGKVAFKYKGTMPVNTTIDIKDGTVSIVSDAFDNQSNLVGITIPKSVTTIDPGAFDFCYNLSSIVVSSSNTVYDSRNNCNAIIQTASNALRVGGVNTVIPSTVKSISYYAFDGRNITSISIPNSVEAISLYAFYNCGKLETVSIGSGLKDLDDSAFRDCSSLKSITVSSDNATYDSRNNCNAVIEKSTNKLVLGCAGTTFPSTVTSIGRYAFRGNGRNDIYSFTIPNTVETIGDDAFYNQSNMHSLTIGSGVTSIDTYAFSSCSKLSAIHSLIEFPFDINTNTFSSSTYKNATLYVPYGSKLNYQGATGWSSFKNIVEIASTAHFPGEAFTASTADGKQLVYEILDVNKKTCQVIGAKGTLSGALTIPTTADGYSVVAIAESAFYDSKHQLTTVTIPESVTEIGESAFRESTITSLTIKGNVNTIDKSAFASCSNLTTVKFLGSVNSIGNRVFNSCGNLTSIEFQGSTNTFGSWVFDGCNNLKKVVVKDIAAWCNTTFPATNSNPLYYAKHLYSDTNTEITDLTIPASVTAINKNTFWGCENLNVTLPNTLKSIGRYSLCYTANTSYIIPASVESIDGNAFTGCKNLEEITVDAANAYYDSRDNCNAIIQTATNTLVAGCKSTVIPSTVEAIGQSAFYAHKGLTVVSLPAAVQSIGDYAFASCDNLTDFTLLSETPVAISENVFQSNTDVESRFTACTLYVPVGTKSAYQADAVWGKFQNIVEGKGPEPKPALPGDLNKDDEVTGTDLVMLVNMILGLVEETAEADVNGDGLVNGTDYVAVVRIILGISDSRGLNCESNSGMAQMTMTLNDADELIIGMANPGQDVTLVQCDLQLPQGLSLVSDAAVDMGSRTSRQSHQIAVAATDNGARLLLSSASNALIKGDEGTIVRLKVKKAADFNGGIVTLTNALCVSPDQREMRPQQLNMLLGADATGISKLDNTTDAEGSVFDLQGRKATNDHKGVGIVNGKKVIVK